MANFKKNAAITAITLSLCLSTLPATALAAEQEETLSPVQTLEYHNGDNNNGEGNGHFDHGNGNGFGHEDKDEKPNKNEKPDKGEDDDLEGDLDHGLDNDQDEDLGNDQDNGQDNSQDEDLDNDLGDSQDGDQDDAAPAPEDHGTVSTPNGVYQGHGMVEFHLTKSAIQAILDNQNAANQTWGQLEDATLLFKEDITCFDHRDMTYNIL